MMEVEEEMLRWSEALGPRWRVLRDSPRALMSMRRDDGAFFEVSAADPLSEALASIVAPVVNEAPCPAGQRLGVQISRVDGRLVAWLVR